MWTPAFQPVRTTEGRDDWHRKNNYDLCTAIDLTKLGIVLERMVTSRQMSERLALIFHAQAESLLAALRSENNRALRDRWIKDGIDPENP